MKNLLLWVMMACLSIVLALSACQMEESKEILDQPTSAFSEEGSSGPEVPEGVSFVEIEIPDIFQADCGDSYVEIFSLIIENEEGESFEGLVSVTLCPQNDSGLVHLEVSSDLMIGLDLTPSFWVEDEDAGNVDRKFAWWERCKTTFDDEDLLIDGLAVSNCGIANDGVICSLTLFWGALRLGGTCP